MKEQVNFGNVSQDYARYRDELPARLADWLEAHGALKTGAQAVDLGAGTGSFSRLLASRGAAVTGVEPSAEMIGEALRIADGSDSSVVYVQAPAEATELPAGLFDLVTAARAWHWFDRQQTVSEVRRLLKPGGFLAVVDSVILAAESEAARTTFELIRRQMPDGKLKAPGAMAESTERRNGFPLRWFDEWAEGGFQEKDSGQFGYELRFTPDAWRGKVRSISWFSQLDTESRQQVDQEMAELFRDVTELTIPHRCSFVLLQKEDRPPARL
ncbi:class I SAM-dependent methyltransferase [Paenibacillus elgii]|uniref:class I SAM-dependent methyltransferase n=1 Tax=Paenibacillus elgii TaxID=189691 RepID=UPI000248D8F1|nr:class I SAM-dependent methyltransferase [Paenibacillus elgii]